MIRSRTHIIKEKLKNRMNTGAAGQGRRSKKRGAMNRKSKRYLACAAQRGQRVACQQRPSPGGSGRRARTRPSEPWGKFIAPAQSNRRTLCCCWFLRGAVMEADIPSCTCRRPRRPQLQRQQQKRRLVWE